MFFLKELNMLRMAIIVLFSLSVAVPAEVWSQDDPEWGASANIRYLSRYNAYGIDLSDTPAASLSAGVSHRSGFALGVGALRTMGSAGELQHWSVAVGYERSVSEVLSLNAEFEHYEYANDSANVLAALANSISFGADLDFDPVTIGVSYDVYLGPSSASYFSFNVSSFYDLGPVYLVPLVQLTFMSQEVENRLLMDGKGKKSVSAGTSGTSVTGLSSLSLHAVLILPIAEGLNFSLHPYFLYSPKSELSSNSSRLLWSAGLRYSLEF